MKRLLQDIVYGVALAAAVAGLFLLASFNSTFVYRGF